MARLPSVSSLLLLLGVASVAAGCQEKQAQVPDARTITIGAYTAPREAFEEALIPAFERRVLEETGQPVAVRASYLGSGAQAHAVIDGFPADVVVLAIEADVDKIAKAGGVSRDWRARTGRDGIVARTLVVIAVRDGNPKGIRGWDDLTRPGLEVLVPNARTSGAAMWTMAALWAARTPPDENLVLGVARNVVVMDKGARESIVNFERGIGDAAITYEQEIHVAWKKGRVYDYVVPDPTMEVDIPAAVVDRVVDARGTRAIAEDFVRFMLSDEGQRHLADYGFRPLAGDLRRPPDPKFPLAPRVLDIQILGGWPRVTKELFGDQGRITRLVEEAQAQR